jgi:ribonuclease J
LKNQPQKKLLHKPTFEKDSLYFLPLGGSEQFGVNMNVYVSGGKFLVVDCGIGFADERFPGIDLVLPDPEFLEQNREKIAGMVITHAHEDHIGAVAYLWKRLQCPVYTTKFTAAVLRGKLNDQNVKNVPVHVVKPNEEVDLGPFGLTLIPVSHSVPDTCSLLIETPEGNVLHSGDWNLDPKPVVGQRINEGDFKKAGQKNIIAYVGDSTNAEVPGRAGSESEVEKGLETEFKKCKGRVAITIFSSNVGRIISVVRAAQKCGRRVAVVGRSLHKMIDAAMECGYLRDVPHFLSEDEVEDVPPSELVMIVTGSQGEFRSALARLARGEHQSFSLHRGDTVIFSARSIPGNERAVNDVKNNLSGAGVNIITPSDTDSIIHVSGHPCRDEIAEMYQWVRPQTVIPVHGERVQLEAHAALARQCQIPNVIVPVERDDHKTCAGPSRRRRPHHDRTCWPSTRSALSPPITARSATAASFNIRGRCISASFSMQRAPSRASRSSTRSALIDQQLKGEKSIEDSLYNEILDILEDMADEDLG